MNAEKPKWSCEMDCGRKLQHTVANNPSENVAKLQYCRAKVTSQNVVHAEVKIGECLLPFGSESLVCRFAVYKHTQTETLRYVVSLVTDPYFLP